MSTRCPMCCVICNIIVMETSARRKRITGGWVVHSEDSNTLNTGFVERHARQSAGAIAVPAVEHFAMPDTANLCRTL